MVRRPLSATTPRGAAGATAASRTTTCGDSTEPIVCGPMTVWFPPASVNVALTSCRPGERCSSASLISPPVEHGTGATNGRRHCAPPTGMSRLTPSTSSAAVSTPPPSSVNRNVPSSDEYSATGGEVSPRCTSTQDASSDAGELQIVVQPSSTVTNWVERSVRPIGPTNQLAYAGGVGGRSGASPNIAKPYAVSPDPENSPTRSATIRVPAGATNVHRAATLSGVGGCWKSKPNGPPVAQSFTIRPPPAAGVHPSIGVGTPPA